MIYDVASPHFRRYLRPQPQAFTLDFCYTEVVGQWTCSHEEALVSLRELLYNEDFRVSRETCFSAHHLPDTVLTRICNPPEESMEKPALSAGGMIVFTPLSSVNRADLLFQRAGKYDDLYMSTIDMPLRLAQQIEGIPSTSSVSLGRADSIPGDPIARMEARMEALQNDIVALRADNVALRNDVVALRADNVALRANDVALQNDIVALREQNVVLVDELGATSRKLRLLSAMEAVLVRKLIEKCREMCKESLRAAKIPFPADDWNLVIDDAGCLSRLTSLGLRRDYGLKATRYGPGARMKQKGDKAAHVISEDKSLYAELVCSKTGSDRESLAEIYKFVFDRSDPEQDCFARAEASTPRT